MLQPRGEWRWAYLALQTYGIRFEEWVNYDDNTREAYIAAIMARGAELTKANAERGDRR